uniref:Uncharacterized protein AlNc14C34G3109 n=1 Tax=Albugo laibachii Nc14 TaxID=890382 RepID=F0W8I3_9STRA|nr:conserved hypothetical protein [Albugo laibachii Nc14]CCA26851.1 conserved hypothetical protein [Albugo laibachii Nc14]|eukprot:CCA26851.1 conserved hypothetical protein [Albugo laibachii Nc14]
MWRSMSLSSRTLNKISRCRLNAHRLHLRNNSTDANEPTKSKFTGIVAAVALSAPFALLLYSKQYPDWNPPLLHKYAFWKKIHEALHPYYNVVSPLARTDSKPLGIELSPTEKYPVSEKLKKSKNNSENALNQTSAGVESKDEYDNSAPKDAITSEPAMVPVVESAVENPNDNVKESKSHEANMTAENAAAEEIIDQKRQEIDLLTEAITESAEVSESNEGSKAAEDSVVKEMIDQKRQEIDSLKQSVTPSVLLEATVEQIHTVKDALMSEMKQEVTTANEEIEKSYLQDIQALDATALSIRVAQLATEMKHRTKWEAVRLMEALKRMETEAKVKCADMIQRHVERHKDILHRELELQERILSEEHRKDAEEARVSFARELGKKLQCQRQSLLEQLQSTFEREKKLLAQHYDEQLRKKESELDNVVTTERHNRIKELELYRSEIRALNEVLDDSCTYEALSHQIHKASVAALSLSERIEAAVPLYKEIRKLTEIGKDDEFIHEMVTRIPSKVVQHGVTSLPELQRRFKKVKATGRRAAMVPDGSGMAGQLFCTALSYLLIPPAGPIDGEDAEAVYSRADYAIAVGDLHRAVKELECLSGVPAQISEDWMEAAKARLAVEQTAKVMKTHIALLAESCS